MSIADQIIQKIRANGFLYKSFLNFRAAFIRPDFSKIDYFCLFIGYPYSGHTIIGALLDAHPEIVISIEADVLSLIEKGYSRKLIYHSILRNNKRFTKNLQASWLGYSYKVSGLYQGYWDKIRVIGDKKGAKTTNRLINNLELLVKLEAIVNKPLKIIHVVRNPLDNIASIILRAKEKRKKCDADFIKGRIDYYFANAEMNLKLIEKFPEKITTVYHEDFIERPAETLSNLLSFLNIVPADDYVKRCAQIVKRSPHLARELVQWPDHYIDIINDQMKMFPFLARYY